MTEALAEFLKYAAKEREQFYALATLNPVKKTPTYHLVVEPCGQILGMGRDFQSSINMLGQNLGITSSERQIHCDFRQVLQHYPPYTIVLSENHFCNLICGVYKDVDELSIDISYMNASLKQQLRNTIRTNTPLSSEQFKAVRAHIKQWGYELRDNNLAEELKLFLEKQQPLGQPILPKDRVTCLDAYGSSHDFWNDVKSAVLKPFLILALGLIHIGTTLYYFGMVLYSMLSRQQGGVEYFSLALRSLLLAIAYTGLTLTNLVLISQVLSMCLRVVMTMPGLFAAIPTTIEACKDDGMLTVAGRGLQGFGSGFCGMFFSNQASQDQAASMPLQFSRSNCSKLPDTQNLRDLRVEFFAAQGIA